MKLVQRVIVLAMLCVAMTMSSALPALATSRQVVYEALCSGLESSAQPAMSAGTTS